MRKIVEFIANAIESYKILIDEYGEARIIVSASMVNNNIIRKIPKAKKTVQPLHLVRPNHIK